MSDNMTVEKLELNVESTVYLAIKIKKIKGVHIDCVKILMLRSLSLRQRGAG